MNKTYCDRCNKEKDNDFVYILVEIIPSNVRYKSRDYCQKCFEIVAQKLDEKIE